jgi:exodeoxyribonuclease-5
MDRNQADLTFLEIVDGWLRERLSGGQGGILAEMVLHSPGETVALIHKIAENLRRRPTLAALSVSPLDGHLTAFRQAAADFAGFMDGTAAAEPETVTIVERLAEMATAGERPDPHTCGPRPAPDLAAPPGPLHQGRRLRLLPQEGNGPPRPSRPVSPRPTATG